MLQSKKTILGISLAVLLVSVLGLYFANSEIANAISPKPSKLVVGFIPSENAEELTPKAQQLEKYLESKLNVDVEVVVPTSYEPLIEGMRFGHVQAAFMDTGAAWLAHERSGAEIILAEVVKGRVYYQATAFVRADSDIQSMEDIKGKRLAFTSWRGSSGFIRPASMMQERGIMTVNGNDLLAVEQALQDTFTQHTFAGGYAAALKLLVEGKVDVAFGADDSPERFLTLDEQSQIRVLEKYGKVPSHVFIVSKDLHPVFKIKMTRALVQLNYGENNKILQQLYGAEALLPTDTQMHMGDFGRAVNSIAGIETKITAPKGG
ncbi:MAG TPA: phosphate/phosphite/phosphonate ABC transporter substrate-binding protein [Nitrososphaerales archaeon]|nr:phosphate/phosphite/phosphonate ABC transporter substrate-binding protein [Nitrososphaerales archaeon]